MYTIICDTCNQPFPSQLVKRIRWGYHSYYLICPHCGSEVLAYAEKPETEQKKKRLTQLKMKYQHQQDKKTEFGFYTLQAEIGREVKEATDYIRQREV